MNAPKSEFLFSDGKPKKLRRSVRFAEIMLRTRGKKYVVISELETETDKELKR
jgi:hypothetical protein